MRARFRYEYGAEPLHLIATAGSLLLGAYGLLRLTEIPGGAKVLIWIVAAALLHDLVALPVYSLLLRVADRAAAGVEGETNVLVESLQEAGAFRQATLSDGQVTDSRSLLALRVNDADLPLDHGYPARVIVPALPGVHNTKWVAAMTFEGAA